MGSSGGMLSTILNYKIIFPFLVLILAIDSLIGFVIAKKMRDSFDNIFENRIRKDKIKTMNRIRYYNINKPKNNIVWKYNNFIQGLLIDLNILMTVENFTSLLVFIYILTGIFTILIFKDMFLAVIVGLPVIIVILSAMVQLSRMKNIGKVDKIMDAEDLICPLIKQGVPIAISKALPSIDYNIRQHYERFLMQYKTQGYTLAEALDNLAIGLGPTSKNFIKKAKIFHYDEREGMASIFSDIIDDNAKRREINLKKDFAFNKINRNLLYKIAILSLFAGYMLTNEMTRKFLLFTSLGRIIIASIFIAFSILYASNQKIQSDIEFD